MPFQRRTVQQMGVRPLIDEGIGYFSIGLDAFDVPDGDHRRDALLDIAQRVDDLAGPLSGNVLERAGGEDVRHLRLDLGTYFGIGPVAAKLGPKVHQPLGGVQDVERRPLRGRDDGVEFAGRRQDTVIPGIGWLERRHLPPGLLDRAGHFQQLAPQYLDMRRSAADLRVLTQQGTHLVEHDPDIVRNAALRALGIAAQEGAPLGGARHGVLDMLELVLGERHQLIHGLAPSDLRRRR